MIDSKLITGDKFIAALMDLGLADNRTRRVVIDATVGEPISMFIEKYGDDRLLVLLENGGITVAHNREEAIAR